MLNSVTAGRLETKHFKFTACKARKDNNMILRKSLIITNEWTVPMDNSNQGIPASLYNWSHDLQWL